jgi:hypothetical protein
VSSTREILRAAAELEIERLRERQASQTLSTAQARRRAKQLHRELAKRILDRSYYLQCEARAGGPETEAAFARAWSESVEAWEGRFKRRKRRREG